jgi:uncharacterized protein YndB with AHSA1/START domain
MPASPNPPSPEPDTAIDLPEAPSVTHEITIDALPEEVWEAVSTDAGRERWLEPDPARELIVEVSEPPARITWWWWRDDEPARHVDVRISPVPDGTRVTVTETEPAIVPLAQLAATFELVLA